MTRWSPFPLPELADECGCRACHSERAAKLADPADRLFYMSRFIVCEYCGNKRCPHATDHRHACTNSNEPGQPGSVYGGIDASGVE